jgi:hypothetical protein
MGREAKHTVITIDGRAHDGDALLETDEVLLRIDGEPKRRKLPIAKLTKVRGEGETIAFEHDGRRYAIEVKDGAAWAKRITSPPSLLDKLGITTGASVHADVDDAAFARALRAAKVHQVPLGREARVVVRGITKRTELSAIAKARRAVGDGLALWIVYPRGREALTEDHVRAAAIEAGLVDVKVARFSETCSALKLVVRKSERKK